MSVLMLFFSPVAGGFVCVAAGLLFLVGVIVLGLDLSRRRRSTNNTTSAEALSSSRLLLSNEGEEQQQQQQPQQEEYKQDSWFAFMSTPAAYRYMNDPNSKAKLVRIPSSSSSLEATRTTRIHLIILVHGWKGRPCSLGYMKDALERQAAQATTASRSGDESDHIHSSPSGCFIVHAATANQEQTSDGVAAGGSRLAKEVNEIICNLQKEWIEQHSGGEGKRLCISLSFVAHSLGGLYARYALSEISFTQQHEQTDSINTEEGMLVVQPAIFCTTCSPHLGLANELFCIPVPRWLQYIMANMLQQTGRDLFRFTSLLEELVMEPRFRDALALFHQRITYVNTYATDFQVSTQTAAFLAETDTIQQPVNNVARTPSCSTAATTKKMIPLIVETQKRRHQQQQQRPTTNMSLSSEATRAMATTAELASEMDALGWTKVFCDVRDEIQSIPRCCNSGRTTRDISPAPTPQRSMSNLSNSTDSNCIDVVNIDRNSEKSRSMVGSDYDKSQESDKHYNNDNRGTNGYTSAELLARFNGGCPDRWHVPSAHLVMVASTKREFLVQRTTAGRPIMDELASRMVQGILQQSCGEL